MSFENNNYENDEKIQGEKQFEKSNLIKNYEQIPNTAIKIHPSRKTSEKITNYPDSYLQQEGQDVMVSSKTDKKKLCEGQYINRKIDGKEINLVIVGKDYFEGAFFDPILNMYGIGTKAMDLLKSNPRAFLSMIFHEIQHDKYMALSEFEQLRINNRFLHNEILRDVVEKFITCLYNIDEKTFAKESSYNSHFNNKQHCVLGNKKGIKDASSIEFEYKGEVVEVLTSFIITELISYTSMVMVDTDEYCRVAKKNIPGARRIMDIAHVCYDYIASNEELSSIFKEGSLFKENDELEGIIVEMLLNKIKL